MSDNGTDTKIALRPQQSLVPRGDELKAALMVCEQIVSSGFMPGHIATKEQAFAIYLRARDLGISFSAAIDHLYPTSSKDRPGVNIGMSAILQRGLAQRRAKGFQIIYIESTDKVCHAKAKRDGMDEWQEWKVTIEEAAKQGLTGKPNWMKDPKGMLVADCTRALCRIVAADVLSLGGGGYTTDELIEHGMDAKIPESQPTKLDETDIIDATNFKEETISEEPQER